MVSIDSRGLFLHLTSQLAVHEQLPVDIELVVLQVAPPLGVLLLHLSHHLPQLLPRLSCLLGEVLRHRYCGLPQTLGGLEYVLLVFECFESD